MIATTEQERITKAQRMKKKSSAYSDLCQLGVRIQTEHGNCYLISGSRDSGVSLSDASNLSSKWERYQEIPVAGAKSIRGVLLATRGAAYNGEALFLQPKQSNPPLTDTSEPTQQQSERVIAGGTQTWSAFGEYFKSGVSANIVISVENYLRGDGRT